jgi:hypothetical protein
MPRGSVRTKRPTAFEQQIAPLSCTPLDSSSDVTEPPRRAAPDLTHRCANLNQPQRSGVVLLRGTLTAEASTTHGRPRTDPS